MAVKDRNVLPTAGIAKECVLLVAPATAVSQAALEVDEVVPGFAFQVVRVEVHATAVTATISADVRIGTTSVLSSAVTPVANTATAGTLSSTLSALRGSSTDALRLHYTSNGTGAATSLKARVWIRPQSMNGEA
jgi:hypothetical protein